MVDRNKVIQVALGEVGYREKASNAYLDDFTANAGNGNYTKYARDIDAIPGFYNGAKQSFDWCDVFADWCYTRAYGLPLALNLICQPVQSAGAGCKYSAAYYQAKGRFFQKPEPGDQIFFCYGGEVSHTGIVVEVNNYAIITVEGNVNGGVQKCSYPHSSTAIYGYGRPCWELFDDAESEQTAPSAPKPKTAEVTVTLPIIKYGDEGTYVKVMQNLLIGKGCSCGIYGADGEFGVQTKIALFQFKKAQGLATDGDDDVICDSKTWEKLLTI